MAKRKTKFVCQECGYESAKWMGKCPACHQWNTMVEEIEAASVKGRTGYTSGAASSQKPEKITSIESKKEPRITTKMREFNRVLGGEWY